MSSLDKLVNYVFKDNVYFEFILQHWYIRHTFITSFINVVFTPIILCASNDDIYFFLLKWIKAWLLKSLRRNALFFGAIFWRPNRQSNRSGPRFKVPKVRPIEPCIFPFYNLYMLNWWKQEHESYILKHSCNIKLSTTFNNSHKLKHNISAISNSSYRHHSPNKYTSKQNLSIITFQNKHLNHSCFLASLDYI